jgi:DNA-binding NarL/FixJ family response regulator
VENQLTASEQGRSRWPLAVTGLSNKKRTDTLFVGVDTIEVHLSHAYSELGVHSRAKMAGRLRADQ